LCKIKGGKTKVLAGNENKVGGVAVVVNPNTLTTICSIKNIASP
jgi:hypothetical protein